MHCFQFFGKDSWGLGANLDDGQTAQVFCNFVQFFFLHRAAFRVKQIGQLSHIQPPGAAGQSQQDAAFDRATFTPFAQQCLYERLHQALATGIPVRFRIRPTQLLSQIGKGNGHLLCRYKDIGKNGQGDRFASCQLHKSIKIFLVIKEIIQDANPLLPLGLLSDIVGRVFQENAHFLGCKRLGFDPN